MADFDYWRRQGAKPLFGEVDVMRPEQRRFAGKLLLIGGNKGMFFAVANAMQEVGLAKAPTKAIIKTRRVKTTVYSGTFSPSHRWRI